MAQIGANVSLDIKGGTKITGLNYADVAEKAIRDGGQFAVRSEKLTPTSLRSIYGFIVNLYTDIGSKQDFEDKRSEIQYLKVRMAYDAGRKAPIKLFLNATHLKDALDCIDSYEQFLLYCRYAESLVAYFKFYDGKDR